MWVERTVKKSLWESGMKMDSNQKGRKCLENKVSEGESGNTLHCKQQFHDNFFHNQWSSQVTLVVKLA